MIRPPEIPRLRRYPESKIRAVSRRARILFEFGFWAAGIRKKMAAQASSIMLFRPIRMGFMVTEDHRIDRSSKTKRNMKKRLILLILFTSACSIFSLMP